MHTLLLYPVAFYTLWHGWLLPLPSWMPPEHPVIAKEERFYRSADPLGYLRFIKITRTYNIPLLTPDKSSSWFRALPDFIQGSGMFVWEEPVIYVNNWDLERTDLGMTMAVVEHELCHVLGRWHPEEQIRTEGIAAPPVDIHNWRTWAEHETYCANIMYRVAGRLGSTAGQQFAKDVARGEWEDMNLERRERFLATYGWWLEPEITSLLLIAVPP